MAQQSGNKKAPERDKALEQGGVELKVRGAEGKGDLVKMDEVVTRCMSVLNG